MGKCGRNRELISFIWKTCLLALSLLLVSRWIPDYFAVSVTTTPAATIQFVCIFFFLFLSPKSITPSCVQKQYTKLPNWISFFCYQLSIGFVLPPSKQSKIIITGPPAHSAVENVPKSFAIEDALVLLIYHKYYIKLELA